MRAIERDLLERTKAYVKDFHAQDTSGHDFSHVFRVWKMSLRLSAHYPVDPFVVEMASLLHDIDDPKLNQSSGKSVQTYLSNLPISDERQKHILSITENMSFSKTKEGKKVHSIEGKIVQDADRLDAIGAIGIARCFAYGGSNQRPIYEGCLDDHSSIAHFYQKLLKLKDLMNLSESKIIAEERTALMEKYLESFFEETKYSLSEVKE